ncbi:MAG: NADPH-dependent FMN reductase [Sciscionella sp.]
MPDKRLQLEIIIGSTRRGRFGPTVAQWFLGEAKQPGNMDVDVIDLVEADLPVTFPDIAVGEPAPPEVAALAPRMAAAFVVVTPEYNHGYPASLKCAIDWFSTEWQAKPIGFVSYGGVAGGLRSVEQLRQVFAEVHAVTMRDTVSFSNYWERFDSEGQPVEPAGCAAAAKGMLDQLAWWGLALKEARAKHPYGA